MVKSAWSPLRLPLFRALWLAALASNIGTTMHDVGAAWLMTSLSPSPLLVALMQTAASLPIFLVALPAGALADLIDRRHLLIATQIWMLVAAATLGLLTLGHLTTPLMLLALSFLLGLGGAMNAPAWQATVPELVPKEELLPAVALNGIGFNLARAVGPAIGGLIVAAIGSWAVFCLNALSYLGVAIVLYRWRRKSAAESVAPGERLLGAVRAGGRYVRHSPALRAVLVRTGIFILCGSAVWALLPVLARGELKLSAAGYGTLLGAFGMGAVSAATALPRVRARLSLDRIVAGATLLFAAVALILSFVQWLPLVLAAMACGGGAWMTMMSTLNASAQTSVPAWVRARALGVYLLIFQGGLAIGSAFWGAVATRWGLREALLAAAAGMVLGLIAVPRFRLTQTHNLDLNPSQHWPQPEIDQEPEPDQGPVLVEVEYSIDVARITEFVEAMDTIRLMRRRDGAYRWGLWHDMGAPGRFVETFVVESWAEHLRQHERVTMFDQEIEEHAISFHVGTAPPLVSHFIAAASDARTQRVLSDSENH
jgi:MFS family permease